MADDIESAFQAAITAAKINGAVICATDAQGNFVYNNAIGERTLLSGEKRPQQLDDVLYLASGTKFIAAVAALQCVDEGLLTLDGDLSSVAPDLAAVQVITGFSDDGETPILEPLASHITLEMLLTHSSGLCYEFLSPLVSKWQAKYNPYQEGTKRPVEKAFCGPLIFQPGSSWMYSTGLDWAGRILERVTGLTLGEHVSERICKPLGVNDAQFFPITRQDLRSRLVDLNPDDPDGLGRAVVGGIGDMSLRSEGHFGGHGLFMTGIVYTKILQSLLANDGKLLKPSSVDEMFVNHLSPKATEEFRAIHASEPMGPFFRVGTAVGMKVGYGLSGLLTMEDVDGWYGEHTLTWGGGLTLTWFIDRTNDLCGFCAVQAKLPLDVGAVDDLKQTFRRDIYRKRAAWKERQGSS